MTKLLSLNALKKFGEECAQEMSARKYCVRICMTGCKAYGAEEVKEALTREVRARGFKNRWRFVKRGVRVSVPRRRC